MPSTDLRIVPKTVLQLAVEKLRGAIIEGVFKPGDRLVEAELCEMLGISRPSLREALRSLAAERLVEIIPNRGPQIPVLSWEHASEIYQMRALLEGEAASLAAGKAAPGDLRLMRASLAAFGKAVHAGDRKAEVESTSEFYGRILRIGGNRIMEETLAGLLARINFLRGRSMSQPGRSKISLREMKAILRAIEAGNGAAARAAAVSHVENAHLSARAAYDAMNTQQGSAA